MGVSKDGGETVVATSSVQQAELTDLEDVDTRNMTT